MQLVERRVDLVAQPVAERRERRPVAQVRRVHEVVGLRVLVRHRDRRELHEPAVAQRVGGEQLAREREAEVLLGGLQHQAGVVEDGDGAHVGLDARGGEPVLPQVAVAEQRLARERLGLRAEQAARGRRRADDDDRRLLEQALGLEPGPRAVPCRTAAWKPFALQVDGAERRVDLERERGWRSRQREMRGSIQRFANDGSTVTRSRCASPVAAAAAACTPSSSVASAACTLRSSACPAGLSTTRRPRRSNSAKPSWSSRPADLLAHRAVGQVQRLGGGAQVLQLRDRAERRSACLSGRRELGMVLGLSG
jgi:hypothetical protein